MNECLNVRSPYCVNTQVQCILWHNNINKLRRYHPVAWLMICFPTTQCFVNWLYCIYFYCLNFYLFYPLIKLKHERHPGFFDAHTHFTGILSHNSIGLATVNGRRAFENILEGEGKKFLDKFKEGFCGKTFQGPSMEGSRAPFKDEDQMYALQFLHVRSHRSCLRFNTIFFARI